MSQTNVSKDGDRLSNTTVANCLIDDRRQYERGYESCKLQQRRDDDIRYVCNFVIFCFFSKTLSTSADSKSALKKKNPFSKNGRLRDLRFCDHNTIKHTYKTVVGMKHSTRIQRMGHVVRATEIGVREIHTSHKLYCTITAVTVVDTVYY